jgi:hypothetical protein
MNKLPRTQRLHELLTYNPDTGVLSYRLNGKRAGSRTNRTYRRVKIDKKYYREHRIIYKMMTCVDPGDYEIDHINRVRDDNRWSNLRIATHGQNQTNTQSRGIYYCPRRRHWKVSLRINGKATHIGVSKCPLLARLMYEDKAREVHGVWCAI